MTAKSENPLSRLKRLHEKEMQSPELRARRLGSQAEARQRHREKQLSLLREGAQAWNRWRAENGSKSEDLRSVSLADWPGLAGADFSGCDLADADLRWSSFAGANFRGASLSSVDLTEALLDEADFTGAIFDRTVLGATDLSSAKGLETALHRGPSYVGVQTLFLSQGRLPESFLTGAGVPRPVIDYLPALTGAVEPIQFNSCFISYASADEAFARRLHARMREAGLRVWFAPEDIKGGEKLLEQLERAIHIHDKLIIVLSEASMSSNWVATELRSARAVELSERRRKLFPIRLVDHDAVRRWRCFDADRGVDLATEVREYFIPDFSRWKEHDEFEASFDAVIRGLRSDA